MTTAKDPEEDFLTLCDQEDSECLSILVEAGLTFSEVRAYWHLCRKAEAN